MNYEFRQMKDQHKILVSFLQTKAGYRVSREMKLLHPFRRREINLPFVLCFVGVGSYIEKYSLHVLKSRLVSCLMYAPYIRTSLSIPQSDALNMIQKFCFLNGYMIKMRLFLFCFLKILVSLSYHKAVFDTTLIKYGPLNNLISLLILLPIFV